MAQQPGGNSNFTIGWTKEEPAKPQRVEKKQVEVEEEEEQRNELRNVKTSVKVHNPPGQLTRWKIEFPVGLSNYNDIKRLGINNNLFYNNDDIILNDELFRT